MDEQLLTLLGSDEAEADQPTKFLLRFTDEFGDELDVYAGEDDPSPRRHKLMPLSQLYGQGSGLDADTKHEIFMPLFLVIEVAIKTLYEKYPDLTDSEVGLALELLSMSPEADMIGHNALAFQIQRDLRLCLSLNDFSRQEVRQALRKIRKSVKLHSDLNGLRGYLDFIYEQLPV